MIALLASAAFWQAWALCFAAFALGAAAMAWRAHRLLREAQGLLRYWEEKQDWGEDGPARRGRERPR